MSDDSQVNVTVLRSVIDSYLKKKERLQKREDEVTEKLAHIGARTPMMDESFEINIETRESIVRTTSQVLRPTQTESYIAPTISQNDTYVQGSGELLFHSKYCAYKDSDKSINEIDSRDLISKYVSMPKKKSTGKSKFSYKNYDKRNDMDLDSDSEETHNVNVSTRNPPKKRVNANEEQRGTREVDRKYDKYKKRVIDSLERVSISDMSRSQVNLNTEPTSDEHRYKKTKATLCKSPENRKMEFAAERLARIGLMRVSNDRTSTGHTRNEKAIDTKDSYLRYEDEDERRDSTKYPKQEKSSRKTSKREADEMSRYPKLMEMLGCCPGGTMVAPERKHKKSHAPNNKSMSRKGELQDFELNRHHAISLRRPIQNPSSTSESGSMSQCEVTDKAVPLRPIESFRSSDEERVRSRSPYRNSERQPPLHSRAERVKVAPTTDVYARPRSERIDEKGYDVAGGSTRLYSHGKRDQTPHSQSHRRDSPASRTPVRDEGYRSPHRSAEERSRPHSAADRVNGSDSVGARDQTPHSQSHRRDSPASRPAVRDEGYRGSHRSAEEKSRPHSAEDRLNESVSVGAGAASQYSRGNRDQTPHRVPHSRGSSASRPPVRDEGCLDSRRSTEQRARTHSPADRLNGSVSVGAGSASQYSRENRDQTPHSQSHSRGSSASRPPVRDEGCLDSRRSTERRSRTHSPAERLDAVGPVAVMPYYGEHKIERSRSPSRDQYQPVYKTPVDNDRTSNYANNFDEEYSNNFLIFLIQNSLPRAMSSILLAPNGCNTKPSEEVLSSVHEIVTIKKLICDELDRRELMGRPFKLHRRDKQRLIQNFLHAKKINDRLEQGFSLHEALSIIPTKSSESTIRLHQRTIQAIRQANRILGGDQPDPADADDLEKAAEECLQNLGELHMETVSNLPYQGPMSQKRKTSPYHKLPDQTCKSCREDWYASEVNRLNDVILNIEQQMNSQTVERAVITRQINEVKKLTSRQNDGHVRNNSTSRSYYEPRHLNETYETTKAGMGNARSLNRANNAHPVQNASFSNAYNGPVYQSSKKLRR